MLLLHFMEKNFVDVSRKLKLSFQLSEQAVVTIK